MPGAAASAQPQAGQQVTKHQQVTGSTLWLPSKGRQGLQVPPALQIGALGAPAHRFPLPVLVQ